MDAALYLSDLERKPEVLDALASVIDAGDFAAGAPDDVDRVLFLGMGSSTYAAGVVAAQLRARGVDAVAELASSDLLPPPDPRTLVVAISASGGSRETLSATSAYAGRAPVVAVTNVDGSPITEQADFVVNLRAEQERGGVACRSYQHTLIALMGIAAQLTGDDRQLGAMVRSSAVASADLLDTREDWLADVTSALDGPAGCWVVAPARRLSNAQQGALMMREGPRRAAVSCETGDWSHVDVYLTKTLDYRMLLFAGSAYEDELLAWTAERKSLIVAVGDDVAGAAKTVRYQGDDQDDVRLLTEVLVPELVAAKLWPNATNL